MGKAMSKGERLRRLVGNVDASIAATRKRAPELPPRPAFGGDAAKLFGTREDHLTRHIPVDRLEPDPDQPRKDFDEGALARLAESLRERGQLQPIRVRWVPDRRAYVIVAGERRWRAAKLAGLKELLCVEAPAGETAEDLRVDQLVENCCREDLGPIEQARAFKALMDRTGDSARETARRLGIGHDRVARALAVLRLQGPILRLIESGELDPSTALECAKLPDDWDPVGLALRAADRGLSRADVAAEVRRRLAPPDHAAPVATPGPIDEPLSDSQTSDIRSEKPPQSPPPARPAPAGHEVAPGVRIVPVAPAPDPATAPTNTHKHPQAPPTAPAIAAGEGRPTLVDLLRPPPTAWEVAVFLDGLEHRVLVEGPRAAGQDLARLLRQALRLAPGGEDLP